MYGPQTDEGKAIHKDKYAQVGETFRESVDRVVTSLSDDDDHRAQLRPIIMDQRFLFGGRIQAAIGSTRKITAVNCFVMRSIVDNFVSNNGIMDVAKEAAKTLRMGGGVGYDFSTLRPRGDTIKKLGSTASGPITFMHIFDAIGRATSSAGHRRGAQMGCLRVDHPDIEEFVRAKHDNTSLTGFNISILVTDKFMNAVKNKGEFDLVFEGKVYRTIKALPLWELIMRSTWDWAEPGVLFIDRINEYNNLYYCEKIAATNPCGEQPLPPFGACILGSFNLTKYANGKKFDFNKLRDDVAPVVNAMDNVVDITDYPLDEQREESNNKRRMGIGISGLANVASKYGYEYGSKEFLKFQEKILTIIRNEAYIASSNRAKIKGSFKLFDSRKYLASKFIKTLPPKIRKLIKDQGIRNSHLLSIAPTGTISMLADNISSGIEPVFDFKLERKINTPDGQVTKTLFDYGYSKGWKTGKTTVEITAKEHIDVLLMSQKYVDSAVSKTCNVDPKTPWNDFKNIYISAWEGGAKGCTTFNPEGKRGALLVSKKDKPKNEELSCSRNSETGQRDCE